MAILIGVARRMPHVCTFGVPVFRDGEDDEVAQEVTDAGTVSSFLPVEYHGEAFFPVASEIAVSSGEPAVFAFEVAKNSFLIGTGRSFANELEPLVARLQKSNPATARAVQRFLSSEASLPPQRADGFAKRFAPAS